MSGQHPSVADTRLSDFAEALASERPTPGGGAAAAVAGSLAAALTAMVVRLSQDRPKYLDHVALHAEALAASDAARQRFLGLADEDAAAYDSYRAARSQSHSTLAEEEAREAATREAARASTLAPLEVVRLCHAQVELVDRLAGRTNLNVASDLEVAALLLDSAARSAAANVRVNVGAVGDEGFAGAIRAEVDQRLQRIQAAVDRARERVAKGAPRQPEGT